jgi:hypothetical protein
VTNLLLGERLGSPGRQWPGKASKVPDKPGKRQRLRWIRLFDAPYSRPAGMAGALKAPPGRA